MEKTLYQFVADDIGGGAVAKDGSDITIEFESDNERLWVTIPSELIERLKSVTHDLHILSADARTGWPVSGTWDASRWTGP